MRDLSRIRNDMPNVVCLGGIGSSPTGEAPLKCNVGLLSGSNRRSTQARLTDPYSKLSFFHAIVPLMAVILNIELVGHSWETIDVRKWGEWGREIT
jgi:hypothetical protein